LAEPPPLAAAVGDDGKGAGREPAAERQDEPGEPAGGRRGTRLWVVLRVGSPKKEASMAWIVAGTPEAAMNPTQQYYTFYLL
jgi:hypothetical protein